MELVHEKADHANRRGGKDQVHNSYPGNQALALSELSGCNITYALLWHSWSNSIPPGTGPSHWLHWLLRYLKLDHQRSIQCNNYHLRHSPPITRLH